MSRLFVTRRLSRRFIDRVDRRSNIAAGSLSTNETLTRSAGGVYVFDHDSILRLAKDNELPFARLRRVENLVTAAVYSSFVAGGAAGTVPPTLANTTYKDQSCFSIAFASGASGYGNSRYSATHSSVLATSRKYAGRLAVALSRPLTGTEAITVKLFSSAGNFVGPVVINAAHPANSTNWTTLGGAAATAGATISTLDIWPSAALSTGACTIYIARINIVEKSGSVNTASEEDVSVGVLSAPYHGAGTDGVKYFDTVNGTTVNGTTFVLTEGTGAALEDGALQLEGQGTNLIALASYRDISTWTLAGVTMKGVTTTLIDGATGASGKNTIMENALTSEHSAAIAFTAATASAQSADVYVRRDAGARHVQVRLHNITDLYYANVTYNLDTLALIGAATADYTNAYAIGNYICIELVKSNVTTGAQTLVVNMHDGTTNSYAGDGASSLVLDWASVVTDAKPQSPIVGASTRYSSFFSLPWIGAVHNFWVYLDFEFLYASGALAASSLYPFAVRKDANNYLLARFVSGGTGALRVATASAGVGQEVDILNFSIDRGDRCRMLVSYDEVHGLRCRASNNGAAAQTSVMTTNKAAINSLSSGARFNLGSLDAVTVDTVNPALYNDWQLGTGILSIQQMQNFVGA